MHRFLDEYGCTDYSFRDVKVHGNHNKTFPSHGNNLEMFADVAFHHLMAVLMKVLQDCALGYKVKTCLLHYTGGGDTVYISFCIAP